MPLYTIPTNATDIGSLVNQTLSNVCIDVDNSFTCGAFIFWDFFIIFIWITLFSTFRKRSSFKDAYAGASGITFFITLIIFLMPYNFVRDLELIIVAVNFFISVIVLFLHRE